MEKTMEKDKGNCFICNREIVLGWDHFMTDDEKKDNPVDAVTSIVTGGYTSRFDCFYGRIFICDPCFMDRVERVIDVRDYMEEAANASDVVMEANGIFEKEMTKLQHPSNKDIWKNIQNNFWD